MMILALLAGFALAQDDCDDPEGRIRAAERELLNFYLSDASVAAKGAVDALGCSAKAHPDTVARLFLTDGMLRFLGDDLEGASLAFGSAKRIGPDQWNPDYGEKAKTFFDGILLEEQEPVAIALKGFGASDWAAVDGTTEEPPLALTPGMHLLQVGHSDVARFARVIEIEPGVPLTISVPGAPLTDVAVTQDGAVTVGIAEVPATTQDPGPSKPKRKRRVIAAVGVGVASAALYGSAVGARVAYDGSDAPSDGMLWTVNGLYGGSVVGGITAGSMMIGALATKPAP